MDAAVVGALAGILGSAVGGAATIYVARQSLPAQAKQAEVATQTLLLHQEAQLHAQRQRWDEERHRTYAEFLGAVSRHRRVLAELVDVDNGAVEPQVLEAATHTADVETSTKYNAVRLLAGAQVKDAAKELLIDVDWYLRAIEALRRSGHGPSAEQVQAIVDKYERDAPRFVELAQAELGVAPTAP